MEVANSSGTPDGLNHLDGLNVAIFLGSELEPTRILDTGLVSHW
jgi:hypothetical protein